MSLLAKAGTLSTPTATGNQSYSVGWEPTVVLFYTTYQTATGTAAHAIGMIGAATSSTARHSSSTWSQDASANSDCEAATSASRTILVRDTTNTAVLSADFVSMDTAGFTLNWVAVNASSRIVHWLALGGDIQAWVGQISSKTTTGTQAYTGVGFLPTAILLLKPHGQGTTTTAGGGVTVAPSFGWASATTARGCMAAVDMHAQTAADSARYQRTDKCYAVLSNTGAVLIEADLTSFDSDGFTLNWTTAHSTARTVIAVALGGLQAKAGAWNQRSGTGSQAVTGVGFQSAALLAMGWGLVADTNIAVDMGHSFGFATAASEEGCMWAGSDDAADPTACDSAISSSVTIQTRTPGTAALVAEAELTSLDSDGFTLNYTTADTTARQNLYLALGSLGGGSPGPWIEYDTVAKGVQSLVLDGLANDTEYEVRTRSRDTSGNTSAGSAAVAGTPVAAAAKPPFLRVPVVGTSRPGPVVAARRGRG